MSNTVLIYNKYIVQLLTDLKNIDSSAKDAVRTVLKTANVRAIDGESDQYIRLNVGTEDPLLLPGVRTSALIVSPSQSAVARPFLVLLSVLAATHHAKDEVLATQVLRAISAVQSGSADVQVHLSAIFDDDIQSRLQVLVQMTKETPSVEIPVVDTPSVVEGPDEGNAFMESLAGSSIATIAKEIADELVDSELLKDFGSDPTKIDFASLLDPNSKLGGVAKVVSSKLHDQLGSGKLDQGKLMSEVMSMFNNLNGGAENPLLTQVMSMAKQMGAGAPPPKTGSGRSKVQGKAMKRTAP